MNEALPDASFTPVFPEGAVPEVKTEPHEGYNRFYVVINDGADGRMRIRVNGQKGAKGTMASGLN